jgi:isopenicillin N synthase-like dioxygenase
MSAQIPVIDISDSNPEAPQQLLSAASKFGFVFVDHAAGFPASMVGRMFDLSKTFFASSTEQKEAVSIASNKAGSNYGWIKQGVEKLDPRGQVRPDIKELCILSFASWQSLTMRPEPSTLARSTKMARLISQYHIRCSLMSKS